MLKYIGHPLVDIGIATITAFAEKQSPTQITQDDLDNIADFITQEYTRQPLKSFLTVAFPNSGFTQPAFEKTPKVRLEYANRVLRGYQTDIFVPDTFCAFTGEPAIGISLDVKDQLAPGRAFRQHIPLLNGEGVINFYPNGDPGLPISSLMLLAIQAFPLGCAKCGGRLLAVHSDNEKIIHYFASTFLRQNRELLLAARISGSAKMPESEFSYRTLFISKLLEAYKIQTSYFKKNEFSSTTIYHLTNMGQSADVSIHHLPLQITTFLRDMGKNEYRHEWNQIVQRAWEKKPESKKNQGKPFQPKKNWLYEDLFGLHDDIQRNAKRFLRTYFLRAALRYARGKTDPRIDYSLYHESDLVSWKITARFLREVMNMNKERVEQIRDMGDQLAEYVSGQNDRRFFRDFDRTSNYGAFRNALIKANYEYVKLGHMPIITLDSYIEVFEEGDELAHPDWRLARDLVLIRMVEQLHGSGWLGENIDVFPSELEEDDNEDS